MSFSNLRSNCILKIIFIFVGILFVSIGVFAETYTQIQGAFRSFPQSVSTEVQWGYSRQWWAKNESSTIEGTSPSWLYGYWKTSAYLALHGQAGVKFEWSPISIIQLSFQESITHRFYDTKLVDCLQADCRSPLGRSSVRAALALGYDRYFMIPSYSLTQFSLSTKNYFFASEEDNLMGAAKDEQFQLRQIILGAKIKTGKIALVLREGQMKKTHNQNRSQYLVYSHLFSSEWSSFLAIGEFSSNGVGPSNSVLFGFQWKNGSDLALF